MRVFDPSDFSVLLIFRFQDCNDDLVYPTLDMGEPRFTLAFAKSEVSHVDQFVVLSWCVRDLTSSSVEFSKRVIKAGISNRMGRSPLLIACEWR